MVDGVNELKEPRREHQYLWRIGAVRDFDVGVLNDVGNEDS